MNRPRVEVDPLTLQCFSSAWQLAGLAVVENGLTVQALEAVQRLIAEKTPPTVEKGSADRGRGGRPGP
jgi:hypothetical protein